MPEIIRQMISAGITAIMVIVVTAIYVAVSKSSKLPKRVSRLENALPIVLRGQITMFDILAVILKCQQGDKCNGDLDASVEQLKEAKDTHMKFLSDAAISQRQQ